MNKKSRSTFQVFFHDPLLRPFIVFNLGLILAGIVGSIYLLING